MFSYPMALRIGSQNAGRDGEYYDATDGEAVEALRGGHDTDHGYHRGEPVYVVRTWPEDVTIPASPGRREVTHRKGEPVFGEEVTVYPVGQAYGGPEPAKVSWSAPGAQTTAEAAGMLELMAKAVGLARAANNRPCARCAAEYAARYYERDAAKGEQA